ncbi:helix-hairpin-helix protein [Roseovarius halotolerans]|uniref:Helix-hairpin-helix motif protein n=1 Tax=Roseovarius halotolerans TaxID=505353 RepID=A0A1X6Y5X8_9RHOB|nr:helix-hairpin-helix domain-containing protein [Roseovarius halotolerans]RKT35285.1 helix-hairpin-helix protein [Roseovarius halotolerans]SLN11230.1 Helix-hairpin-helix motif protein [Roseovarius halotolerans]
MSNFAELSDTSHVLRVVSVPDDQEHRGQDFLATDLGLGGTWVQTSYSGNIRNKFAGIGDFYDADLDIFASPAPAPDYTLNAGGTWSPPPAPAGQGWAIPEGETAWHLDINLADAIALDELDGVGPTVAHAIISERDIAGLFASLEDLAARVDGIGTATTDNWTNAFAGAAE